jgi:hypothetical protein
MARSVLPAPPKFRLVQLTFFVSPSPYPGTARSVLPALPKFRPLAKQNLEKIDKSALLRFVINFFFLTVSLPGDGQVREVLPAPLKFRLLAKKIRKKDAKIYN